MTNAIEDLHGSDLVLLMLAAPTRVGPAQGRINGVTRLEKLLYLADRETDVSAVVADDPLVFTAYNYGPFSKEVYEAVDLLEESELLTEERQVDGRTLDSLEDLEVTGTADEDEYVTRCFVLTQAGEAVAQYLGRRHPDVVKALSEVKDQYAGRSLSSLIRYVYQTYPESAEKSKIRDRYL